MEKTEPRYQAYLQILKEELIPAMGCTDRGGLCRRSGPADAGETPGPGAGRGQRKHDQECQVGHRAQHR